MLTCSFWPGHGKTLQGLIYYVLLQESLRSRLRKQRVKKEAGESEIMCSVCVWNWCI